MNTQALAQAPASTIPKSGSANETLTANPAASRRVRVGITNSATKSQRQLVVPWAEVPALLAGLSPAEQLGPAYTDTDDPDDDVDGIFVFEAPAAPDCGDTPSKLWSCFHDIPALYRVPCVGVPFADTDFEARGLFHGARFIVPIEDNDDPGLAAAIGEAIAECSVLAGARVRWAPDYSVSTYQGARLRVVPGVGPATAEVCASGALAVESDSDLLWPHMWNEVGERVPYRRQDEIAKLLPPLTLDELDAFDKADCKRSEKRRLAGMSDYERVASMLGSAEPVFFAATRDLSGPAVMETLAALQSAAAQPDPLASFVRAKAVPLADRYRTYAADRARFEMLVTTQLRNHPTYLALPPEDVARVNLAAWLFAAPASLFVGKGSATVGPLIVPGHGEPRKTTWLVEGLMPSIGLGAFVGGAGEGKSYIAVDLAARVATVPQAGMASFAGNAISGAPSVLYCGCEGVEGWTARAERQIPHVSRQPATEPHGLRIANGVPLLSSPIAALTWVRDQIDKIVKAGGQTPALIIIDHLRGAMTGNEDSSGDMDLALSTAWAIARMCGCFVLLIHHARKNSEGGAIVARGSSAIKANLDLEATIKKSGDSYWLAVTKNRNGKEGDKFSWHIPETDAPLHEGVGISLTPDDRTISARAAETAGRAIWEHATKTHGITTKELNDALAAAHPDIFIKPDSKRDSSRLLRARTDAMKAGYAAEGKGKKWIPGETEPPPARLSLEGSAASQ